MTTTDIQFDEKQEFETIKNIIESKFDNVKIHTSISDLKYISFNFKGQTIHCSFMKDNRMYGKNNELTECSSFSSDRPNEIKTEAFRIIAKCFNCKMWENDCIENNFEIFKVKKTNNFTVYFKNGEEIVDGNCALNALMKAMIKREHLSDKFATHIIDNENGYKHLINNEFLVRVLK